MPERKNDGILSLNVKKLLILHLVWKTNREFIFQYAILVRIWRDNFPKYGGAVIKFFLGTVLTTGFGASVLSKDSLMYLSTKSRW